MIKPSAQLNWQTNPIIKCTIQAKALLKDGKTYNHSYCINELINGDYKLWAIYYSNQPNLMEASHHKTLEEAKNAANQHYLNFLKQSLFN